MTSVCGERKQGSSATLVVHRDESLPLGRGGEAVTTAREAAALRAGPRLDLGASGSQASLSPRPL